MIYLKNMKKEKLKFIGYLGFLGFLGPIGIVLYSSTGKDIYGGLMGLTGFFGLFAFLFNSDDKK
ncbi:MAG: hypothetical protein EOM74_00615 [Methanomicrobia archaeon]|nr:hypothetical protein [Methanomicrobia archaeon]